MPTVYRPKAKTSGPTRHVYDVIIVGGHLAGAIAGALLAKRGHRILLVEHDGLGHGYPQDGLLLPYAPFVAPPLKSLAGFDEVLSELGLSTILSRQLKPHSPDLQLILPSARLDLHHDDAKRAAELSREFGEEASALDATWKAATAQHEETDAFFKEEPPLPPLGMFESMALKRLVAKHPNLGRASVLQGANGPFKLLSNLTPFLTYMETSAELAGARPISQALASSSRFLGGREGLRELFCKKITDHGGDLLTPTTSEVSVVEEFSFDGSKVAGVKILQSGNTYRADCVVGATDAGALRRLIPDKKKQRDLAELFDTVRTKRFLFAVNWVLPVEALPRGMGDLLLVDTQNEDLGAMLVQVNSVKRVEDEQEEERKRVVCAGVFIPSGARELGEQHLKDIAAKISAQLDQLMPFAKDRLLLESAPYLDAGGVRGSRLMPHPLNEIDSEHFLGVSGLSQRTGVKNFFLANREVLPGLGLEGEIMAGARAAKLVQESAKKSDPLRR